MNCNRAIRLTSRALDKLSKSGKEGSDVWDSDLTGFHVRLRKGQPSFRVAYYNKLGKQRVVTLGRYGAMTAVEAREAAREVLAVVAQGQDPRAIQEASIVAAKEEELKTLGAYLEGPYKVVQDRKKDGKGTLDRIARDFSDWLDKPMSSLDRATVERWQAEQEAKEKPRAFSTLKRSYDSLHALLVHATERKVIEENPLEKIKLQKPALTEEELAEQSQRRYLEDSEVKKLFLGLEAYQDAKRQARRNSRAHGKAYLPSLDNVVYVDHVKPWILTMYYTGFRPGDLFGLRWEHIDFNQKTIRKVIEKTAHHCPEPMTFPLSSSALSVLLKWNKQLNEPTSGFVFPSPVTGKRLDKTSMKKPWYTVRKLSGLSSDLVLYTLRHNFASQLVMADVDLLTVSKLMAHTDIQTTIKYYAHLKPNHTRDAVEAFGNQVTNDA